MATQELRIVNTAVDRVSSVINRVSKSFPKLKRQIAATNIAAKRLDRQFARFGTTAKKFGAGLKNVGRSMTTFITLPLAALGAFSLKAFGDFEQGLAGVQKTTDISGKNLERFGEKITQLSLDMPVSTKEMLELAKAAGQLGVSGEEDLLKFTEVMAKVGRATNVVGEEGAQAIARILKLTNEGPQVVDRFASSLVLLGNTFETTESQILTSTSEITRGIGRFDSVTSAQTLALGTALSSLGIRAESGGTVITRTFNKIQAAIVKGGRGFEALQKLTGKSGDEVKKAFNENTVGFFQDFIQGLTKVPEENILKVLSDFGISGLRVAKVLPILIKRSGVLTDALKKSGDAWVENTALQKEFGIQSATFNSEMIKLKNSFTAVQKVIGNTLAPTVSILADTFKGLFGFLTNNPTFTTVLIFFGALVAILGPILLLVGTFISMLPFLTAGFATLSLSMLPVIANVALIAAAIAGLIFLGTFLMDNWRDIPLFFKGIWETIKEIFIAGREFIANVIDTIPGLEFLADIVSPDAETGGQATQDQRNTNRGLLAREKILQQNAKIQLDINGAPRGSRVSSQGDADVGISMGFMGVPQ